MAQPLFCIVRIRFLINHIYICFLFIPKGIRLQVFFYIFFIFFLLEKLWSKTGWKYLELDENLRNKIEIPAPAGVFGQMDNFYTNAEDVAGMVSALGLHLPARIAVEIIRIMTL